MEITFSSEELRSFVQRLSSWYRDRLLYLADQLGKESWISSSGASLTTEAMMKHFDEFERKNPKPEWRTLLRDSAPIGDRVKD
jgi:hypothetical protein